jgi:hypothetical protein
LKGTIDSLESLESLESIPERYQKWSVNSQMTSPRRGLNGSSRDSRDRMTGHQRTLLLDLLDLLHLGA